ncbi:MAG: ArsR family transcriptional regulator, partial [Candidatus Woesearchaeota archaeon]
FRELRQKILAVLLKGRKTVNQLAKDTGINWKTVDNHLIWLKGRGFVREVFASSYVKIYELSEEGRKFLGVEGEPR